MILKIGFPRSRARARSKYPGAQRLRQKLIHTLWVLREDTSECIIFITPPPPPVRPMSKGSGYYRAAVTMIWSVDATLELVDKGGLIISLEIPTEGFHFETHADSWPGDIHEDEADQIKNVMLKSLSTAPFEKMINKLRTALKDTFRFVLPSSGTLFYKDPIFNDGGDLLVEVRYDG